MPDETPETTETQPEAQTPPAEPAVETKTLSSPWAQDLQTTFQDPAVQAQVDEFLRAQVQPYVTKLEQDGAENRKANNLWNDFSEYPEETFRAIAKEFYPEQYDQVIAVLDAQAEAEERGEPTPDFDMSSLPAPVREAVEYYEGNKRQTNWEKNLAQLQADNPDIKIDGDLLAPWVNVANGDMALGLEGYKAYLERTREFLTEGEQVEQQEPGDAPQVIGSSTSGPTTPPIEKKPETLDEAIDDFWEELKAKRAPQVVQA